MGVGRIVSREGPILDFQGIAKEISVDGVKNGEILFYHSKLIKQPFDKKFDIHHPAFRRS